MRAATNPVELKCSPSCGSRWAGAFRRWTWATVYLGAGLCLPATAAGQSYQLLHVFTLDGANPQSTLIQAADGNFYGAAPFGGAFNLGSVFKTDLSGNLTVLHSFAGGDGANPGARLIQIADGNFYGTTGLGGIFNVGTVFKMDSLGNLTVLHSFDGSDGARPDGLIQAAGNFYGTTSGGGSSSCAGGCGTVFRMDSAGNLTVLHRFMGSDGADPSGLIQAADGKFYGTTASGGIGSCSGGCGTVFGIDSTGNLTVLHSFMGSDGEDPSGLIQATDGKFYGTTASGGARSNQFFPSGFGTVFRIDSAGNLTMLHSFSFFDGANPQAGLIQAVDGNFYGTTYTSESSRGPFPSDGTVFKMDALGNLMVLHSFAGYPSDGSHPKSGLIQAADGSFYGTTSDGGASGYGTVFKMDSLGNLTVRHGFGYIGGAYPVAGLIQAADGNFYGTGQRGGAFDHGAVFRMDSSGTLTVLHSFNGSDGVSPETSLIQATDGNFYGTTLAGGANGSGTVFRMDAAGNLTVLHSLTGSDGANPSAGLIQATDGNFYGTTENGPNGGIAGTVFRMDAAGNLTVLYSFAGHQSDGAFPLALIQATDGNFYGTAGFGGAFNGGTIFKMDFAGKLTVLHSFNGSDGAGPAGLIQAADGYFYGTTTSGGRYGSCYTGCGTVFRMDSTGNLTVLHSFTGSPADGASPGASVIEATDGNFYGTTVMGGTGGCLVGAGGCGTVFKLDSSGHLTLLHSFTGSPSDGAYPDRGLIQAADGNLYGTTAQGGINYDAGTVFRILTRESPIPISPSRHPRTVTFRDPLQ